MFGWFNQNYVFINSSILELLLIKLVKQECYYVNNNNIFSATEKAAIKTKQFLKQSLLHTMLNLIWSHLHKVGIILIIKKLESLPFINYTTLPSNIILLGLHFLASRKCYFYYFPVFLNAFYHNIWFLVIQNKLLCVPNYFTFSQNVNFLSRQLQCTDLY